MAEPTTRRDLLDAVDEPVLTALAAHATRLDVQLFLVGGPVRDLLAGRAPSDLDIASRATPAKFRSLLASFRYPGAHLSVFDVGEAHGTTGVYAAVGDKVTDIEHTTFRSESYTPGSRTPTIAHVDNLLDDLARRDFTVNAMALDLTDGTFWDPFDGADDLRAHRLRCPADPLDTFRDDPLRISRMVRFAAVRGLEPDRRTRAAAQLARRHMASLSAERIAAELDRIVTAGPQALARAGELCDQLELGPQVLASRNPGLLARTAPLLQTPSQLRALLAYSSSDPAGHLSMLRSTRRTTREVLSVIALLDGPAERLAHRARSAGQATTRTAAELAQALNHDNADTLGVLAALDALFTPLPITGQDVLATGRTGRDVGMALDMANDTLVATLRDTGAPPTRQQLLDVLRTGT
jgi:hypothetical protein